MCFAFGSTCPEQVFGIFLGVELGSLIWVCMSQDMLRSGTADAASMANVLKAYKTTSQWQEAPWVNLSYPIIFSMP